MTDPQRVRPDGSGSATGLLAGVPRVLIVGQAPTTPGGMAGVQRLHESALARRDDVTVSTVVTYDESGVARRAVLMVTGITRAVGAIVAGRVDVVHVHVSRKLSALRKGVVLTAARLRGVPTVMHTHAGAFLDWFDSLPRPARALVRWLLRADRVVVLSDTVRGAYAERLGLPADHVVVVTNPVEWPETVPERDPAGPVDAVFLGRLIDRKGVFDVVDALAALGEDTRARLHVTLAGHGDADAVRAAVAAADLEGTVDVRTWIGPDERDELLGRAQLLLLPSWWEGLPMAVLEAMAWGVTPVVTPVGGLVELVRDGDNGVVVPVQDPPALAGALEKLLADDELRQHLGARARADVRGHGTDVWADRLVGLYRTVLDRPTTTWARPPDQPADTPDDKELPP